jgi:hypothetical protein
MEYTIHDGELSSARSTLENIDITRGEVVDRSHDIHSQVLEVREGIKMGQKKVKAVASVCKALAAEQKVLNKEHARNVRTKEKLEL